jgi:hypothetical protein
MLKLNSKKLSLLGNKETYLAPSNKLKLLSVNIKITLELVQLNHTIYFFERNMIILQYNKKLA